VLLSLLVPGFGLVRAGRPLRGLLWFVGLQLVAVGIALLFIARPVPNWIVGAGMLVGFAFFVAILVDSFRPGRLTWPLAFGFVSASIALVALPSLPQLIAKDFKVPTAAMEPTLLGAARGNPDHIVVDRVSYLILQPKRGDLVVFRTLGILGIPGETFFVKRLVGLPGERIEIRDGRLFADGQQLDESAGIPPITYTSPEPLGSFVPDLGGSASYTVPNDSFFFLGDNSANSYDSRYWGSVPRKNIYGKVSRIYYPLSRIGVPH
jgi:signal peptidase I